jgi:hypothetical protein
MQTTNQALNASKKGMMPKKIIAHFRVAPRGATLKPPKTLKKEGPDLLAPAVATAGTGGGVRAQPTKNGR